MEAKGSARWAIGDGKEEPKKAATPQKEKEPIHEEKPPRPLIKFQWLQHRPKARPEKNFQHYELPANETKAVPMTLERELKKAPEPNVMEVLKKAEEARLDKLQFYIVTDSKEQLKKEDTTDVHIARYTQYGFSRTAACLALALHGTSQESEKAVLSFCEKFDELRKAKSMKPCRAFCQVLEEGLKKSDGEEQGTPMSSFVVVNKEAEKPQEDKGDKGKSVTGQLQWNVAGAVHSAASKGGLPDVPPRMPYGYGYVAAHPYPHKLITNSIDLRRYNSVPGADFKRYGL